MLLHESPILFCKSWICSPKNNKPFIDSYRQFVSSSHKVSSVALPAIFWVKGDHISLPTLLHFFRRALLFVREEVRLTFMLVDASDSAHTVCEREVWPLKRMIGREPDNVRYEMAPPLVQHLSQQPIRLFKSDGLPSNI